VLDVARERERQRGKRLRRMLVILGPIAGWMWIRALTGNPVHFGLPQLPADAGIWLPGLLLIFVLGAVVLAPMLGNARSPHVTYRPEQIEVGFRDVIGLGPVLGEVQRTLQVFLDHRQFQGRMGGRPRRGVLFEGPPGTGKTHVAKAMAKEAGVPFLFVSSTAFQSMWYGMTGRRIKSYFRALRKAARKEGGAIGFIEEIDAIGTRRANSSATPANPNISPTLTEGVGGVVNELLIQLQSFDEPTNGLRVFNWMAGKINRLLPVGSQIKTRRPQPANILLIGATNRADSLDPALLRPGRFDRILHFDIPGRRSRRELVEYFLARKAHTPELDTERAREELSASTQGYSPASLEHLFDEALLVALRNRRDALTSADLRRARMEVEIGLPQPADYTPLERTTIAVHESGHATVAYLVGKGRRLEVLSIIKRREALGLLAHTDIEERFTKSRSELTAILQIALGGMVAEEIFFGESGTGPAGDLEAATNVAVEMVGSLGMSDSLISFRSISNGMIGGNLASRVLADKDAREAINNLLDTQKREVTKLLAANRHLVEALRDALLEREELIDDDILEVLRRATGSPAPVVELVEREARERSIARHPAAGQ